MSPEPFVSRAKALSAKRSEKGYGDENALETKIPTVSPVSTVNSVSTVSTVFNVFTVFCFLLSLL